VKKKQENVTIKQQEESAIKKPGKDYEYYDMIVRDLISEIKGRSSRDFTLSPPPQQKFSNKHSDPSRGSPQKRKEVEYGSIKVSNSREKMVFSLSLSGYDTVYERKITSYIEFLYKLNFSNKIYIDLSLSKPKTTYKVKIGPGNNGMLIRSLLKRRFWL
jgi:hypothetical protein